MNYKHLQVLRRQARFLGDYEQVHLRRSRYRDLLSHCPLISPFLCCNSVRVAPPQRLHLQAPALISITPRRPTRSQYVHFNKATAALFLRQTESLWLNLELTRQAGETISRNTDLPMSNFLYIFLLVTELLLDRPVGVSVVYSISTLGIILKGVHRHKKF